jgi:hypothetical protein
MGQQQWQFKSFVCWVMEVPRDLCTCIVGGRVVVQDGCAGRSMPQNRWWLSRVWTCPEPYVTGSLSHTVLHFWVARCCCRLTESCWLPPQALQLTAWLQVAAWCTPMCRPSC